jgi:hypothetical protein
LSKNRNAGAITICDFKLYYKVIVVKNSLVLAQEEAQRLMKQNGIPRNKSTHLQPSDFFTNETKAYIGEKTACSTNGTGKTGY